MKPLIWKCLLGLSLCSLVCLAWAEGAKVDPTIETLIDEIETIRTRYCVSGAGLTLVSDKALLWAGGFGVKDIGKREPVTADTLFRIGSVTKTFTALALLMAQEDGELILEDHLAEYVPESLYDNPWAATHPIRIAHLLEHTAGFHDLLNEEWDHNDPTPISLEDALAFRPASRTSQWKPGTHYSYSNSGAGLAAYVLEHVTGERYEEFVERRIFEPLGMRSAGYFLDEDTNERLATGYDRDGKTVIPYWHMIFRPLGGINVSVGDMAPFLKLLINRGRYKDQQLLRPESISRLETPRTTLAAKAGLTYGYGLGTYTWTRDGALFHGHGGDGDGYLAHYGYNRDVAMGYFLVINLFNHAPLRAMRAAVERFIIRELTLLDPKTPDDLDTQALSRFVGMYELATWRFPGRRPWADAVYHISMEGGVLYTRAGLGRKLALLPTPDGFFRRRNEPVATAAFVKDETGQLYLQGDMGNYRKLEARSREP